MFKKVPKIYPEQKLTLDQVWNLLNELLDEDLEECIMHGFEKLDIHDESSVKIKALKMALFSTFTLHRKS